MAAASGAATTTASDLNGAGARKALTGAPVRASHQRSARPAATKSQRSVACVFCFCELFVCVRFAASRRPRQPDAISTPGPHREGRHGLARLARGQVEVPRDRRLAEDGAEPRLDDGAAPVRRAHREAVADDGERRAARGGRRHAGRLLDDAAAVEAQQRDAQRAVAVEHAERAVARAEGSADDRRAAHADAPDAVGHDMIERGENYLIVRVSVGGGL